ncbi:MAG TPA: hypothetical protein VET23_09985 [Chitinophagaceae bacterium]|nr:hypothetical protein [Chitinophagaceae bacterium]
MYDALYQFLIQQNELSIPGIGAFSVQRKPAQADFTDKSIHSPQYEITLNPAASSPSKKIFTWLADFYNISEREAVIRFNDFVFDMKNKIEEGKEINWKNLGLLSEGREGKIIFTPFQNDMPKEGSVEAQKIIREHAEHIVLVGEKERTSFEMEEMLRKPEPKRTYWWVYALAVVVLIVVFICWYFSEYGMNVSSTANKQKIISGKEEATYTILP